VLAVVPRRVKRSLAFLAVVYQTQLERLPRQLDTWIRVKRSGSMQARMTRLRMLTWRRTRVVLAAQRLS
jgi:hypothetical protein